MNTTTIRTIDGVAALAKRFGFVLTLREGERPNLLAEQGEAIATALPDGSVIEPPEKIDWAFLDAHGIEHFGKVSSVHELNKREDYGTPVYAYLASGFLVQYGPRQAGGARTSGSTLSGYGHADVCEHIAGLTGFSVLVVDHNPHPVSMPMIGTDVSKFSRQDQPEDPDDLFLGYRGLDYVDVDTWCRIADRIDGFIYERVDL